MSSTAHKRVDSISGHRRVKSLVRELDNIASLKPAAGPSGERSTSSQHSRSRSTSPIPSGGSDGSPDAPSELFSPASSTASMSTVTTHSHQRKRSVAPNLVQVHEDPRRHASTSSHSEDAGDEDDEAADERDDVFLPLTPVSASFAPLAFPSQHGDHISSTALAPLPPNATAAQRREHSRKHSRAHSRNLSVFFPRPGEAPVPQLELQTSPMPVDIPSAKAKAGQHGGWGAAQAQVSFPSTGDSPTRTSGAPTSRRGHHHRHSLSHNYFGFADPAASGHSSDGLTPTTPSRRLSLAPATPHGPAATLPGAPALRTTYGHLPMVVRLGLALIFHLPLASQLALLLGSIEMALGAALWITGQAGESLAVTGLGYLVVFDALGAFSAVLIEGRGKGIDVVWDVLGRGTARVSEQAVRYPFGTHRLVTLSLFTQCVYLLFSAVYVCKESVEHVLLMHGPGDLGDAIAAADDHGAVHGSMGHGEVPAVSASGATAEEGGIIIPTILLVAAALCCLATALLLRNHASLANAGRRPRDVRQTTRVGDMLSNAFSMATIVFASGLAAASLAVPGQQLAPLDKIVALLESIAMFYIAYPAASATGKVLLQTAPMPEAQSMTLLARGVRNIEDHPRVARVEPPHVWQISPQAGLVATVRVHLRSDASDAEVLDVTRFANDKINRDASSAIELTVNVDRGEPRVSHVHSSACGEHSHDHGHEHGHSHSSHSHSHDHSSHAHGSAHSHDHGHSHNHPHDDHGHSHHDHGHQH